MTEVMPGMSQMTASPPWAGFRCIFRPLVVFGSSAEPRNATNTRRIALKCLLRAIYSPKVLFPFRDVFSRLCYDASPKTLPYEVALHELRSFGPPFSRFARMRTSGDSSRPLSSKRSRPLPGYPSSTYAWLASTVHRRRQPPGRQSHRCAHRGRCFMRNAA